MRPTYLAVPVAAILFLDAPVGDHLRSHFEMELKSDFIFDAKGLIAAAIGRRKQSGADGEVECFAVPVEYGLGASHGGEKRVARARFREMNVEPANLLLRIAVHTRA